MTAPTRSLASRPTTAQEIVSSRRPCRISSWANAMALRVQAKPPSPTWSPSRTSAAASLSDITLLAEFTLGAGAAIRRILRSVAGLAHERHAAGSRDLQKGGTASIALAETERYIARFIIAGASM